jgi:hypothetical protein
MEKTFNIIILAIACVLGYMLISVGETRSEQAQCHELVRQSEAGYDGHFYITQWQRDMCNHYLININADVQN